MDVAKLIIGGVILAGLMKQDIDYWTLATIGIGAVLGFIAIGLTLIKLSDK
ncbi:MAG: ABC transporter permease [Bacteroidaceae bacterium]|nr:ABC transporter permease [Bacteroidaceae bacterium]